MKALKIIGGIVLALILLIAILTFSLPVDMNVERQIEIEAPKDLIKEHVVNFEKTNGWSPWADIDPDAEYRYEGELGEVGSKMYWEGNEDVGKGNQEIIAIEPNRVETKLVFIEPFESEAIAYHVFEENDDAVEVKWGFNSKMPRPFNVMTLFMDMDAELGKDYEKGLSNLKEFCEDQAEKKSDYKVKELTFDPVNYIIYRDEIQFSEIKNMYEKHLPAIYQALGKAPDARPAGAASGIYYDWNETEQTTDMAAAVPFEAEGDFSVDGYDVVTLKGDVYSVDYYGDYEQIGKAHEALHHYFEEHDIPIGVALEEYVTDPESEPDPSKWLTRVYYFAR